MTQRQTEVLKVVLPFMGLIFAGGIAWRSLAVGVEHALPETRFEAESIRVNVKLDLILDRQSEGNARLKEICEALRAGCR